MKRLLLILALFPISLLCKGKVALQTGDIIFQTSRSSQSLAIQTATGSKYSHMGIIFSRSGRLYVLEAIDPVCFTPLSAWVQRGQGHHYVVKRVKNSEAVLTPKVLECMLNEANSEVGKSYDYYFEWSDSRLYCSELVWKVFHQCAGIQLASLKRLRDFNLSNPIVSNKLKQRFGQRIQYDEEVVSPADIFESGELITVEQK